MIASLERYFDRKTVVDYGDLWAIFGYGIVAGVVISIVVVAL
jgi:hypothetical protein